jgi:hypothetical protein
MLTPSYRCTRCGCEATAAHVTLVESMGWLVPRERGDEASLACLCGPCRRPVRHALRVLATASGDALATSIS